MNKAKLELRWVGKEGTSRPEPRILLEDQTYSYHAVHKSSDDDSFENVLIHGDNLLALKSLEQNYTGQIKCIYIDPPYNTGSAFTHFEDGIEHSLWLTLLRDRLEPLRRLLREDGSIWISIDDREGHYLKVLCDEVFGRSNFISTIVWQKKYTQANDAVFFSDNHDFILVFAKNRERFRLGSLPRDEKQNRAYKNPDNDERGPWKATPLHAKSGTDRNFSFEFSNGVVWSPPPGTFPRFSVETLRRMDQTGEIWFGRDGTAIPSRKTYLSDVKQGVVPKSIWLYDEVGHNHEARTEAKQFAPDDPFDNPKPERLIHRILELATSEGDLVLDSFGGSGTTGAVAHKMKRRWIMVELGNHCYTHIIPRLKKVIDAEDQGGITKAVDWKGGGGFRFYELAPSLLKKDKWDNYIINPEYNAEMLAEAMCKHLGFMYEPSDSIYWMHGHSTESDFIYITTQNLTREMLQAISDEVGDERTLLICCKAFRAGKTEFPNLTLEKIPNAILKRCEWDKDDYSLQVESLKAKEPEPGTQQGLVFDEE